MEKMALFNFIEENENEMDWQDKISYQKDRINELSCYIKRTLRDEHTLPSIFYTYINEFLERCDYLVNDLDYTDSEFMSSLPDIEMLYQMYEQYESKQEKYWN